MADMNYVNPTSIRPEYGYKPEGFLAGMNYASDRQRYEDVSSLQDYMMKNQAIESGNKLQDYEFDKPVREAKRLADIATSKATVGTVGRKAEAEVTGKELENQLTAGTMASKIAEAATKAAREGDTQQLAHLKMGATIAGMLSAAAGSGPGALAGVMQQLEQAKADPRIVEWFRNSTSVEELQKKAQMVQEAFLQADTAYQQHMRGVNAQVAGHEQVARISAASALAVAQERSKTKTKTAEQILQSLAGKAPENVIATAAMVANDPEVDYETRKKAADLHDKAVEQRNAAAKNKNPPLPGVPAAPVTQLPFSNFGKSGQPSNQPSDLPPGVVRLD